MRESSIKTQKTESYKIWHFQDKSTQLMSPQGRSYCHERTLNLTSEKITEHICSYSKCPVSVTNLREEQKGSGLYNTKQYSLGSSREISNSLITENF